MNQLYINIKKRRESLGMSQRDLAAKCGYRDHTTIAKMEKGKVDVTMGRLEQIAAALMTTPLELTGWLDKEDTDA
jgi:transcriptional regulator with XRE-family HTH domain